MLVSSWRSAIPATAFLLLLAGLAATPPAGAAEHRHGRLPVDTAAAASGLSRVAGVSPGGQLQLTVETESSWSATTAYRLQLEAGDPSTLGAPVAHRQGPLDATHSDPPATEPDTVRGWLSADPLPTGDGPALVEVDGADDLELVTVSADGSLVRGSAHGLGGLPPKLFVDASAAAPPVAPADAAWRVGVVAPELWAGSTLTLRATVALGPAAVKERQLVLGPDSPPAVWWQPFRNIHQVTVQGGKETSFVVHSDDIVMDLDLRDDTGVLLVMVQEGQGQGVASLF